MFGEPSLCVGLQKTAFGSRSWPQPKRAVTFGQLPGTLSSHRTKQQMAIKMMPQVYITMITAWQCLESHPFVWAFRRLLLASAAGRSRSAVMPNAPQQCASSIPARSIFDPEETLEQPHKLCHVMVLASTMRGRVCSLISLVCTRVHHFCRTDCACLRHVLGAHSQARQPNR
jgi:hypothetical protein